MEFVDGEPLSEVIRRSGQLEPAIALSVATSVAAGLEAIQKQNLGHRDIKPSNIMVSLEGNKLVNAKIIDLGLAKGTAENDAISAISNQGAFAGTPQYASPEQFTGVGADIRSDLYSLGITLWEMLTGKVPFSGSAAEVMHQHLHTPLPGDRLKRVPQPAAVLLDILLEKTPEQRFQTPDALLKAMSAVTRAIEAKRTIKHQELQTTFVDRSSSRREKLPTIRAPKRSIAVLPFDTLSHGKKNPYFADGVQDEILSNLAKVSELKVISRTSVMTYRPGGNRDLRSIATSLGVANVVEGTVRRDRNRIRITVRLVDARTDKALWSETYDRDLTDIFAVQSEIAQTVASRLSAQLSPEERKGIEEKPTNNLEAYDLYLRAKQLLGRNTVVIILWRIEKTTFSRAISLLEEATQKDRNFALAYCMIAKAHDYLYSDQVDRTPERRTLGDAAVNEALRLRPDLAEVHLAAAFHLYTCDRDFERARVQIAIAAQALPNNSDLLQLMAFIDRVQGRWEKATASLDRAASLNPRNPELLFTLADTYRCRRRYRDNERVLDRLIELEPDQPLFPLEKARSAFAEKADLNAVRAAHEALPASMKDDVYITWERVYYAMCTRDFAAAGEIVSKSPNDEIRFFGPLVPRQIVALWLELVQGNHPTIEQFGAAREQLYRKVEADRTDPFMLAALALADVALGRKEESIQEARRAMEMRPISEDAEDGPCIAANVAVVYAWANRSDFAFEQLNTLIKKTSYLLVTYGNLKTNPSWDPMRKDPRFEKLLAELAPKD
jgi:TolB-like protein/Tfp pilus assembly protein PilF